MNVIRNGVIIWHTLYSWILYTLPLPIVLRRLYLIIPRSIYTGQTHKFYQRPWTLFKAKASYILFLITGQRSKISPPVTTPATVLDDNLYGRVNSNQTMCPRPCLLSQSSQPANRNTPCPVPVRAHAKCNLYLLLRPPNRYHRLARIAIQLEDKVFCTIDRKTTLIRKGTLEFRWPLRLNLFCAIRNTSSAVSYSHPPTDQISMQLWLSLSLSQIRFVTFLIIF